MSIEILPSELVARLDAFGRIHGFRSWRLDGDAELIFCDIGGSSMCVREFIDGSEIKNKFINFQNEIDEYFSQFSDLGG